MQQLGISRRHMLGACLIAPTLSMGGEVMAQGSNYFVQDIPIGFGVKQYTVRRDRAERSFVTLEYFNYTTNLWIIDNVVDPPEDRNNDRNIVLKEPQAFQPGKRPLRVRVSGVWMPDNSNKIPMGKTTVGQYNDRVEIFLYAKPDDQNATAIARLIYTGNIPPP